MKITWANYLPLRTPPLVKLAGPASCLWLEPQFWAARRELLGQLRDKFAGYHTIPTYALALNVSIPSVDIDRIHTRLLALDHRPRLCNTRAIHTRRLLIITSLYRGQANGLLLWRHVLLHDLH